MSICGNRAYARKQRQKQRRAWIEANAPKLFQSVKEAYITYGGDLATYEQESARQAAMYAHKQAIAREATAKELDREAKRRVMSRSAESPKAINSSSMKMNMLAIAAAAMGGLVPVMRRGVK